MRARLTASVVLATLVLAGTTACTYLTPQATTKQYDPSDGIGSSVGELDVRNALLLTEDGKTANLLVTLSNRSTTGLQVKVQYENADGAKVDESVFVNAGSVKNVGTADAKPLTLTDIDAKPGSLFPVYVQYDDVTGAQLWLPVLDGASEYYAELLPQTK